MKRLFYDGSLGSVAESGHKMTLPICGCVVGGAMRIVAIILLMPVMTELFDLLALVAVVTFVATWVACGSERIFYAGWQVGLAFFTTVLQGFRSTLNMKAARNRVIGILLGNVVSYVVLATIWPVRVGHLAASSLPGVLTALGKLLRGTFVWLEGVG